MYFKNKSIFFSPSDLITFMDSPFSSHMERYRLQDSNQENLMDPIDPILKNLQTKGLEHENSFLQSCISNQKKVKNIENINPKDKLKETKKALEDGVDVIAQAYLELDNFGGIADFLIKVPGSSLLGNYHYEVWDTKLSKKMKPYFAIQLCCYAEMLEIEQGILPEKVAIVLGDNKIKHLRVRDYFSYYCNLKSTFMSFHNNWKIDNQPDPAESTSHGRWSQYAKNLLTERRHLSLIANITKTQIKRLQSVDIFTIDELVNTKLTIVPKLNNEIFIRLKTQAEMQVSSEGKDKPNYKVLSHDNERSIGLSLLAPHSNFDIFFDLEGFPYIEGGLEYLWGASYFDKEGNRQFKEFWAHNGDEERQAFSNFVDWAFSRWRTDPSMHIYHYGSYEITALRRLMGRYGIKEYKVDTLLRNEVFIDLYNVVRNGVLIGEPSYSIKNIERIYREKRDTEVASGGDSIVVYEEWRSNPDGLTWQTSVVLNAIRDYNIDDCHSTQELTEWLRSEQLSHKIKYLKLSSENTEKKDDEEKTEITYLRDHLLKKALQEKDNNKKNVIRNLAWILEFHKRENKPTWWRLFDRLGLTEIDLNDDMDCLVGLERTNREAFLPTPKARNYAYEYSFDQNQPFKGQSKSYYVLGEDNFKVTALNLNLDEGLIILQSKTSPKNRVSLIPDQFVSPAQIPNAIQDVIENLIDSNFYPSAIVDFLFRKSPRFINGPKNIIIEDSLSGSNFIDAIVSVADELDNSFLCIQGPPGAGKTLTARHIIADLMSKGKRIGISSNSHKAIINLMDGVSDHLRENKIEGELIKVGGDDEDHIFKKNNVSFRRDAKSSLNELNNPSICLGGTAWLFCNSLLTEEEGIEKFDYLFIDEAGQVSIANLVGMSRVAKNIILMGDQMQLGQPIQGSHPDESGQSILEYLLEGEQTISPSMGIFLPETYRMHPDICRLISDQVYDSRLNSAEVTNRHIVNVPKEILPIRHGIHFVPVIHEGNTQGSEEEVEVIKSLTEKLINVPYWPKEDDGKVRFIGWSDILFVAPYNYQVNLLKSALNTEAKVGSVDKFQGQESPIVILSMCASDASESPRGIEFLFSKNRLNVAISRAQSIVIVVGSPNLANTSANNLKQMELINFYSEIVNMHYGNNENIVI